MTFSIDEVESDWDVSDVTLQSDFQVTNEKVALPQSRANFSTKSASGGVLNETGLLSPSNSYGLHVFTVESSKTIYFGLSTQNSGLIAVLCEVDLTTGTAYLTDAQASAGSAFFQNVNAGTYAIYVTNTTQTTTQSSYQIMVNYNSRGTLPLTSMQIVRLSNNFSYLTYSVGTKYYIDGYYLFDINEYNKNLRYTWNYSGFYSYSIDVDSVVIKDMITMKCNYRSSAASSNNCILIYAGQGTMYTFTTTIQGVPGVSLADFNRPKLTPRRFDNIDVDGGSDQIIVYDYVQGKAIDFYGSQHLWYANGEYSKPNFSFIS